MGKRDSVERFRARFAGVPEAERAMRERGDADPNAVVDEVNRRRLEASPMPVALRVRWRAKEGP